MQFLFGYFSFILRLCFSRNFSTFLKFAYLSVHSCLQSLLTFIAFAVKCIAHAALRVSVRRMVIIKQSCPQHPCQSRARAALGAPTPSPRLSNTLSLHRPRPDSMKSIFLHLLGVSWSTSNAPKTLYHSVRTMSVKDKTSFVRQEH